MIDYLHGVELTPLRKLLFTGALAGGKEVEDTASGNPLTFLTDLARPLKELLVAWTPTQSGSGDPSPENVRPISGRTGVTVWHTGKNLLDVSQFKGDKVWWAGTLVNGYTNYYASNKIAVVPNAKYTLYKSMPGQNQLQYFDADGQYISQNTSTLGQEVSKITIPDGVYFIGINLNEESLATAQLEVGNSSSENEAYSGASFPVTFPALGKNLLDPSRKTASGNNAQYYRTGNRFLLKGGQTYTISTNVTPSQISIFKGTNTPVTSTTSATLTYTPTEDVEVWIDIYVINANLPEGGISDVYGQLELGDTAHSYEPYNNTIYGGTLDLVSGVLTATYALLDMDSAQWVDTTAGGHAVFRTTISEMKNHGSSRNTSGACDHYPMETTAEDGSCFFYEKAFYVRDDTYADAAAFSAAIEGQGYHVAYELATPVEYQLTPQEITALIGTNTIWSNANGDCSVTYVKKG